MESRELGSEELLSIESAPQVFSDPEGNSNRPLKGLGITEKVLRP